MSSNTCTQGCNIGGGIVSVCSCYTPYFSCNAAAGPCLAGLCAGECQIEGWLIAVLVVVPLLLIGLCVACCWRGCRGRPTNVFVAGTTPNWVQSPVRPLPQQQLRTLPPFAPVAALADPSSSSSYCSKCGAAVQGYFCGACGAKSI